MAEVPPRLIRRAITIPGTLGLAVIAVLLLPVTLVLAALHDVLHPRHAGRAIRCVIVVTVFLWIETWAIVALFALWVRAGLGRRMRQPDLQRQHYQLVLRYLDLCLHLTQRLLNVRVQLAGVDRPRLHNRPLLVFCRHAGVGDSLLIVHALMQQFDREPRIVLKDVLQWAPALDIALGRLPCAWISAPAPGVLADRAQARIGALATGLDGNDALMIFPEGGNFTPKRWRRAVDRLRREGRRTHAQQAQRMRNVLPPRPGGVLAALQAAPEADVIYVAHTGTDHLLSAGDVWRALPLREPILMRWWQIPAAQVPLTADAQIGWLYAWWERIDAWIAGNRPVELEESDQSEPEVIELPGVTSETERPGLGTG